MYESHNIVRTSQTARCYGLRELARRAGVTAAWFHFWKIEISREETLVYVQPGTRKHLRFPNNSERFWQDLRNGILRTARRDWMRPPAPRLRELVPEFVVPFSDGSPGEPRSLFRQVSHECVECSLDLPIAVVLTLSRYEELLPGGRDLHGRFPANSSIAARDGFLHRPVVDEWGLALEQALSDLVPQWRPPARELRVKISHDADNVGLPFSLRSALRHAVRRGHPFSTLRDLSSPITGANPTALDLVQQIVLTSLRHNLDSAVYWKASPPTAWDHGYDPRHPKIRGMIRWLDEHDVENGIHPSYFTYLSPARLLEEVQLLKQVLGDRPLGGRQHYLRWCPETWEHWEACDLAYDSSLGYADQIGFRAGTCFPYRPWLLRLDREARLTEIPLVAMDKTLIKYMGLTPEQSLTQVLECVSRCQAVGGVFTLLWHNTSANKASYRAVYSRLLNGLADGKSFDWRKASAECLAVAHDQAPAMV